MFKWVCFYQNIWDYKKNNFEFEKRAISNVLKKFNKDWIFWGVFGNYSHKIFVTKYKSTSMYLSSGHKMNYLLNNKVFFRYIFLCPPGCGTGHNDNIIIRNLELILIDRPNLDDRPTKETLRLCWQHYWSMLKPFPEQAFNMKQEMGIQCLD